MSQVQTGSVQQTQSSTKAKLTAEDKGRLHSSCSVEEIPCDCMGMTWETFMAAVRLRGNCYKATVLYPSQDRSSRTYSYARHTLWFRRQQKQLELTTETHKSDWIWLVLFCSGFFKELNFYLIMVSLQVCGFFCFDIILISTGGGKSHF